MTLPTWIKEIEERADAAEKGPWSNYFRERVIVDSEQPWRNPNKESVEFISHSRTDIPKLLKALEIAMEALSDINRIGDDYDSVRADRVMKKIEDLK